MPFEAVEGGLARLTKQEESALSTGQAPALARPQATRGKACPEAGASGRQSTTER